MFSLNWSLNPKFFITVALFCSFFFSSFPSFFFLPLFCQFPFFVLNYTLCLFRYNYLFLCIQIDKYIQQQQKKKKYTFFSVFSISYWIILHCKKERGIFKVIKLWINLTTTAVANTLEKHCYTKTYKKNSFFFFNKYFIKQINIVFFFFNSHLPSTVYEAKVISEI